MLRVATLACLLSACAAPAVVAPAPGYGALAAELTRCVEHERAAKDLGAMSIALVDGDEVVWAAGFGEEREGQPATAETVYRVGSVSKLFTDLALMQLVEEGVIALDDPVQRLVPGFAPGPGAGRVTFRQLTGHRAGIVREPPVGNYFADDEPSLEATVDSLNDTGFRAPPGTVTKYSNAGIAVLGRALELHHGEEYTALMRARVLRPLGLPGAAFAPTPAIERRLAEARMWSYDGREAPAPTFQLGMAPAGSLYASVLDLSELLRALFEGGRGVVAPETLDAMLRPGAGRFGIGFALGELDGRRRAGHGGAIYGFSTELAFLPDDELGVVVTSAVDVTNAVTSRLATHALRCLVARRAGAPLPTLALTTPLEPEVGAAVAGRYIGPDGERAEVVWRREGHGWLEWRGMRGALRREGTHLRVDGRNWFGPRIERTQAGLAINGTTYRRVADAKPAACPAHLREYVGEYGWNHNVLLVREVDGALEALVEWFWFDALTEAGRDRFTLPTGRGLYPLEEIVFERSTDGAITAAVLGGVRFVRRATGAVHGEQFTIDALHPEERVSQQPVDPELVIARALQEVLAIGAELAEDAVGHLREEWIREHDLLELARAERVNADLLAFVLGVPADAPLHVLLEVPFLTLAVDVNEDVGREALFVVDVDADDLELRMRFVALVEGDEGRDHPGVELRPAALFALGLRAAHQDALLLEEGVQLFRA